MFVVDRIYPSIVVCQAIDTEENRKIPREQLPADIKEGDVVVFDGNQAWIDREETNRRSERIRKLLDSMFQ